MIRELPFLSSVTNRTDLRRDVMYQGRVVCNFVFDDTQWGGVYIHVVIGRRVCSTNSFFYSVITQRYVCEICFENPRFSMKILNRLKNVRVLVQNSILRIAIIEFYVKN